MADFSWTIAAAVFVAYFLIDILYALYVISVGKRAAFQAAVISSMLYSLAAYGVVTYSKNFLYVIPLALGAFLGTYVVVKRIK
jgi:hypothetical protein